jgi:hypothetical protein
MGVSNLCVYEFEPKIYASYICKSVALYHSVTNKVLKEKLQVMNYTQNCDNLIFFSNRNFKLWSHYKFSLNFCVQTTAVGEAAYSVQWYNHSTKFKMMLQMVITRAERPSLIYVGPFPTAKLETFKGWVKCFVYF